jgi:serine/threonine-protein phosphatase 6 regulatory ankyrin repeat subunit B
MTGCINGFKDVTFLLVDAGIEINTLTSKGWSALLFAADNGCYEIVCRLIEKGADVNTRSKDVDWTPLMSASANGFLDIAEKLISKGADVNARQAGGWSPLMIAVGGGHTSLVRLLLRHKAIIFDNKMQICHDITGDQSGVPDNAIPLLGALLDGNTDMLSLLLAHGADPETKNSKGETALIIAASRGSKEIINVLLRYHAKIPYRQDLGRTAFHIGWIQATEFLKGFHKQNSNGCDIPVNLVPGTTISKSLEKID